MIFNFIALLNKKGYKFFKYQLVSVVIFSVLYWFAEYILKSYPELSRKLYFGYEKSTNQLNPYYYWLWYSLITQTTVGYGGIITSDGDNISLLNNHSNLYKLFNFAQFFSIFYITAIFI